MKDTEAITIIRDVAEYSGRVYLSHHAKEQMRDRAISRTEVNAVLKHGEIVESVHQTPKGSYKTSIESYEAGRCIRVAVAIDYDDMGSKLIIVTAIVIE